MTLSLELGQVSDPSARRALEQIALRWPVTPTGTTSGEFFAGAGLPSPTIGNNGAMWLDVSTGCFYGPKSAGAWPAVPLGRLVTDAMTYDQLAKGN